MKKISPTTWVIILMFVLALSYLGFQLYKAGEAKKIQEGPRPQLPTIQQ